MRFKGSTEVVGRISGLNQRLKHKNQLDANMMRNKYLKGV